MMCYRDKTFCTFYADCVDAKTCSRPLTPYVIYKAEAWWGSKDAPIATFGEKPKCHKTKEIQP